MPLQYHCCTHVIAKLNSLDLFTCGSLGRRREIIRYNVVMSQGVLAWFPPSSAIAHARLQLRTHVCFLKRSGLPSLQQLRFVLLSVCSKQLANSNERRPGAHAPQLRRTKRQPHSSVNTNSVTTFTPSSGSPAFNLSFVVVFLHSVGWAIGRFHSLSVPLHPWHLPATPYSTTPSRITRNVLAVANMPPLLQIPQSPTHRSLNLSRLLC